MAVEQLTYRLLVAVDIREYSRRDTREQLLAQRQLSDALDRAARGVGLDRARWDKQVGGDGELATLPEVTDPAPVAGDFVIGLAEALREVNRNAGRFRLRVRLALHHGTLTAGPFGPAGDAPIVVQRLLDATPLRRLLSDDAGRDLACVVSDSLFDDVVRTGFCALPPHDFQAVKVVAKGAAFRGHIFTGRDSQTDLVHTQPDAPHLPKFSQPLQIPSPDERKAYFEEFYRAEIHSVVAFLLRQGAARHEAADAAQAAFVETWLNWDAIRAPRAWVRTVALRAFLRRSPYHEDLVATVPEKPTLLPIPELIELREKTRRVLDALAQLPFKQRAALCLYGDGFTTPEIADVLNISYNAARQNVHRARVRLRELLPPHEEGEAE